MMCDQRSCRQHKIKLFIFPLKISVINVLILNSLPFFDIFAKQLEVIPLEMTETIIKMCRFHSYGRGFYLWLERIHHSCYQMLICRSSQSILFARLIEFGIHPIHNQIDIHTPETCDPVEFHVYATISCRILSIFCLQISNFFAEQNWNNNWISITWWLYFESNFRNLIHINQIVLFNLYYYELKPLLQ